MKALFLSLILSTQLAINSSGHKQTPNSLNQLTEKVPQDTNFVKQLLLSANQHSFSNPDTGLAISQRALELARNLHYAKGEAGALNAIGEANHFKGDLPRALKMQFEALQINRDIKDRPGEAETLSYIGIVYIQLGQYREALKYLLPADKISEQFSLIEMGSFVPSNIGEAYSLLNLPDSALYYQKKAYKQFSKLSFPPLQAFVLRDMGVVYAEIEKTDSALIFYNKAIIISRAAQDQLNLTLTEIKLAELYRSIGQYDSSLYHAHTAFVNAKNLSSKQLTLTASRLLAELYRDTQNYDSTLWYLDIAAVMRDSLYGPEKIKQLQLLMLQEQERQQSILQQNERFKNQIKYAALFSALGIFLLVTFMLVRNNRHKQKANTLLTKQKNKIEETLTELKSTQSQLIQREKMASLGELTAGIAHEIQNPLNFVNNFSEVSNELLVEMDEEIEKGNTTDAKAIASDLKQNLEKILHHGKRADAIVKGMLQHSRSSSGVKEPTDINTLCDEYLHLSYHGLRAKDKTFNAKFETIFDISQEKINVVPQDIGRVILNLINNAFYAVTEKSKQSLDGYQPIVSVSTKKDGGKVLISVKDNGNGIPKNILDKIFQPFFSTKPTGQGTGLGLSLSYDIVKAHGGELRVETKEGKGTVFTIELGC